MSAARTREIEKPETEILPIKIVHKSVDPVKDYQGKGKRVGWPGNGEHDLNVLAEMARSDPELIFLEKQLAERMKREVRDDTSSTESGDEVAMTPISGSIQGDFEKTDHSEIDKRAKENEKRAHEILDEAKNVPAAFAPASPFLQGVDKDPVFSMGQAIGAVSFQADLAALKAAQLAHSVRTDQAAAAENTVRARMSTRVSTSNFSAYFFDSFVEGAQDVKLAISTKDARYLTRPVIKFLAWLIACLFFSYTVKYTFQLLINTLGAAIAAVLGTIIGSIKSHSIINSPFPVIKNTGYILNNYVNVSNNMGTIVNNFAPIMNNNGTVVNNFDHIKVNFGVVDNNFEDLYDNFGKVGDNYRRITRNFGTVEHNHFKVSVNRGKVENNHDRIEWDRDVYCKKSERSCDTPQAVAKHMNHNLFDRKLEDKDRPIDGLPGSKSFPTTTTTLKGPAVTKAIII